MPLIMRLTSERQVVVCAGAAAAVRRGRRGTRARSARASGRRQARRRTAAGPAACGGGPGGGAAACDAAGPTGKGLDRTLRTGALARTAAARLRSGAAGARTTRAFIEAERAAMAKGRVREMANVSSIFAPYDAGACTNRRVRTHNASRAAREAAAGLRSAALRTRRRHGKRCAATAHRLASGALRPTPWRRHNNTASSDGAM